MNGANIWDIGFPPMFAFMIMLSLAYGVLAYGIASRPRKKVLREALAVLVVSLVSTCVLVFFGVGFGFVLLHLCTPLLGYSIGRIQSRIENPLPLLRTRPVRRHRRVRRRAR